MSESAEALIRLSVSSGSYVAAPLAGKEDPKKLLAIHNIFLPDLAKCHICFNMFCYFWKSLNTDPRQLSGLCSSEFKCENTNSILNF